MTSIIIREQGGGTIRIVDASPAAVAAANRAEAAAAAAEAVGATNDTIIAGRINTPGSATRVALDGTIVSVGDAPFRRGRSVVEFGAVGGNATLDTAAFQAAMTASDGTVFVPVSPSGSRYVINAPLTIPQNGTARSVVGLGNGMVEIEYTGTGFMFDSVSTDPADPTDSPIDLYFENLRIDGYNQTTADGAFRIDGAYFVNFDRVEVRRFLKAGAVGMKLHNSFSIDIARSNVLSITNGVGIEVGGSLQQVTNFHLHDFILQRSGVNLDITTGITGGGMQVDNGAIRANDAQIAVRMTGKYSNIRFGPALHIESETVIGSNTTKGFAFSGGSLYAAAIKFEGIDFYNVKTLFDLDGSGGTLRDVEINHVVATALTGLAGTAFKLNTITPGFRLGRYQIASAEYTTLFNLTATDIGEPIFIPAAQLVSVLGSASLSNVNRWPVWLLDAASSEIVAWVGRVPRDWNNVAIDVVYVNGGAGSGDVVMRTDVSFRVNGQTTATPGSGSPVTVTAAAQNVIATTQLLATTAVTASSVMVIDLVRVGGDAADTLANDIGVLGLFLRRVG